MSNLIELQEIDEYTSCYLSDDEIANIEREFNIIKGDSKTLLVDLDRPVNVTMHEPFLRGLQAVDNFAGVSDYSYWLSKSYNVHVVVHLKTEVTNKHAAFLEGLLGSDPVRAVLIYRGISNADSSLPPRVLFQPKWASVQAVNYERNV